MLIKYKQAKEYNDETYNLLLKTLKEHIGDNQGSMTIYKTKQEVVVLTETPNNNRIFTYKGNGRLE